MKVGYIRCSTVDQNLARQEKMMEDHNVEEVFSESKSAKDTDRPRFKEMMAFIRKDDVLYVESISRIARNTKDLLNIVSELNEKGVEFISLKENINTQTPQGRFVLTIFAALAELERESILERQREGIEIAKAQGKYHGRKPIDLDVTEFKKICSKWRANEITATKAMELSGLKKTTFYRKVNELNL